MGRQKQSKPVADSDGIIARVGRDRLKFEGDVIEWIAAWLLVHWNRADEIATNAAVPGIVGDGAYQRGIIDHATRDMECISRLIGELCFSWKAEDYALALERVGQMVWASDDAGRPVTRIGEAVRGKGPVTDGVTSGGSGTTVPAGAGTPAEPGGGARPADDSP